MLPESRGPIFLVVLLSTFSTAHGLYRAPSTSSDQGTSRALIIVGLPGDSEHDALFRVTAKNWREWLVGRLQFPSGEVRVLSGQETVPGFSDGPATRESIGREVELLRKKMKPDDRIWVFVLGHANVADGHAFLHLPGPDMDDEQFSGLFRGLPAREQVFWLTTAASGSFVKSLSAAGRIVVAATESDGEFNETEFPHVLSEIALKTADQLDLDHDGKVSVQEVFELLVEAVEARFAGDKRAPTEHAQLDDNGDGIGTEHKPREKPIKPDGSLSSKTFLPYVEPKKPVKTPARSENGTDRIDPPTR